MTSYERYSHHGNEVWVRSDLKGKHRDYCLCYSCRKAMCPIAKELYRFCVREGTVNPIWECPEFEPNPGVRTRAPLERIRLDSLHPHHPDVLAPCQPPPAGLEPEYDPPRHRPDPQQGSVVIPVQDDDG